MPWYYEHSAALAILAIAIIVSSTWLLCWALTEFLLWCLQVFTDTLRSKFKKRLSL